MSPELHANMEGFMERRQALLDSLRAAPSGLTWCALHSRLADEVVAVLHQEVVQRYPNLPKMAVIATGGYGRGELSPYSDIDITVVPTEESSADLDAAIRELYHLLNSAFTDMLGLQVGYAYRLVSDAAGLEAKTRTGLMDMRVLAGSHEMYKALEGAMIDTFSSGEFVLAKIQEREAMFARYNDTPLVVEPNLKEGAGGLRCFHCANWLREAVGERSARAPRGYDTIMRYRNLLHLTSGKGQEILTRQRQADIADVLGRDMYEIMSEIATAGAQLHAYYRRATEKLHESRFKLSDGLLAVQGEARPVGDIDGGIAAVGIGVATQLAMRISDIQVPTPSHIDGPAALYAMTQGEATVRNLDKCGLLKYLLPELHACRFLMPNDTVHQYTVFEHTLRCVRHLDSIDANSFLGGVRAAITDLEPLYLAALLHDVGKVQPGRPHSTSGAEIAHDVCQRWGLATGIRETVEWLVREHLTMARFLRVRDIMNPETIEEFAAIVGTVERLHLLTLLTWADVSAVADGLWTPAQDMFMRELHERTEVRLLADQPIVPDLAIHRQRLLRQINSQQENAEEVQRFINSLPAYYLASTPPDVIRLHLDFARRALEGIPTIEFFDRTDLGASEVTICTPDQPGLLSRILGVFYAFDLSVSEIRASTTATSDPVALDVFTVSFGGRPVPVATRAQVSDTLLQVIRHEKPIEDVLRGRGKDPVRKQNVFSYTYVAGSPGILEIRAPRGRGMAYRFSRVLSGQGWNVLAARVGQWAGNATAAFYIQKPDGLPVTPQEVQDALTSVAPALPGLEG